MRLQRDIRAQIDQVIREETRWLRHYESQVIDNLDPLNRGRVKVTVPELGFDTPDKAMWCFPRQGNSMSVPEKDSWVDVYFVSGDPNKPRYLHYASEMKDMTPTKFDGQPATRVIFESPVTNESIKYTDGDKVLAFLEGSEHYVLGDKLKTELQKIVNALTQLNTDFTTWVVAPNDGGAALKAKVTTGFLTKAQAVLTGILSSVIKGK